MKNIKEGVTKNAENFRKKESNRKKTQWKATPAG
jgi:hypothetical protein